MRPWGLLAIAVAIFSNLALARQDPATCGTHPLKAQEERFLHRQAVRKRLIVRAAAVPRAASATQDQGNIAILDTGNGILVARNQFDLDLRTLTFLPGPSAATYGYQLGDPSYDASVAAAGLPLPLGDDDTTPVALPFSFPFYGAAYQQIYVNSDGNLTFAMGDGATTDRSLGRMAGGAPRISPLLADLDPSRAGGSGGVRVLAEATRFVVTWDHVPQYSDSGAGPRQTFQVRLYPDGRIQFAWAGIAIDSAVVGIAPGDLRHTSTVLSFLSDPSGTYSGLLAERFSNVVDLDLEAASQQFYQTHDDAYDYLVFYNNMNIGAGATAVSWEETVRNQRTGYGDVMTDVGAEYGSARRLQAVLNMGNLSQFPTDPKGRVPARGTTGDTPITVLAHETGHLFLAYASIRDPADPAARPMLGFQKAHWIFNFNSDASLLEGNRIRDDGSTARPEFTTVGTVEGYSPLDQYLMGFLPPDQVEPVYPYGLFLVTGVPSSFNTRLPQLGVTFDGSRRNIYLDEIIAAEGRRTPDSTVSQRRFRFAFVLLVAAGTAPTPAQVGQLETYRTSFEPYYRQATGNQAFADTALRRSLHLSTFPAAGAITGRTATATLTVETPPAAPLPISLAVQGAAGIPPSVTIPAGASSVSFALTGLRPGVDDLSATPADGRYDTAYARIQVSTPAALHLSVTGAAPQPIVARVTDINDLPYPGVRVQAVASTDGSVTPAIGLTDTLGSATFRWTPGFGSNPQLTLMVEGAPEVAATVVSPNPTQVQGAAVLNEASLVPSAAPGMLAAIYGIHLAGGAPAATALASTRITLDGRSLPLNSADDGLITFYIPPDVPVGSSQLVISNPLGSSPPVAVTIAPAAPGLFYDYVTGLGQGLEQPVHAGDPISIFGTGLGLSPESAQVSIAGWPAAVTNSGPLPGFLGINRIDAVVPDAVPPGLQSLTLAIGDVQSNAVKIGVE